MPPMFQRRESVRASTGRLQRHGQSGRVYKRAEGRTFVFVVDGLVPEAGEHVDNLFHELQSRALPMGLADKLLVESLEGATIVLETLGSKSSYVTGKTKLTLQSIDPFSRRIAMRSARRGIVSCDCGAARKTCAITESGHSVCEE